MKGKALGIAIALIIIALIVLLAVKNWDWISGFFVNTDKKCEKLTAFECVRLKAKKTKSAVFTEGNVGFADMLDYPDSEAGSYRFYSDGKVIVLFSSPQVKGTYNKTRIKWESGAEKPFTEIFK